MNTFATHNILTLALCLGLASSAMHGQTTLPTSHGPNPVSIANAAFGELVALLKVENFDATVDLYTSDAFIAPETPDWWVAPTAMPARFASIPATVMVQFTAPGSFKVVEAKFEETREDVVHSIINWGGGAAVLYIRYMRASCAKQACPWKMSVVIDRGHNAMAACNVTTATPNTHATGRAAEVVSQRWGAYTASMEHHKTASSSRLYAQDSTVIPIYTDESNAILSHAHMPMSEQISPLRAFFPELLNAAVVAARFESPQNQRVIHALINWGGRVVYQRFEHQIRQAHLEKQGKGSRRVLRGVMQGNWLIKDSVIKGLC